MKRIGSIGLLALVFFFLGLSGLTFASLEESPRSCICLNGEWEYRAGGGKENPPSMGWEKIRVPQLIRFDSWPQEFSIGENERGSPIFWYRLRFTVPSDWQGKLIKLKFGAVNHYCKVWVNGEFCGEHLGLLFPFEVDISKAAKFGKTNILQLLVEDSSVSRIKSEKGAIFDRYINNEAWKAKGIYQDVWLMAYPKVYTQTTFVITSVRNREIKVRAWVINEDTKAHRVKIKNEVVRRGKTELKFPEREIILKPGERQMVEVDCPWLDPQLWGIGGEYGNPILYFLSTGIEEGDELIDRKFTRFGFREFWIERCDFYLNGKKIYLQGDSNCIANSVTSDKYNMFFLSHYYKILKEANYNILRWHGGIIPPISYEVADEMGLLLKPEIGCMGNYLDRIIAGDQKLKETIFQQYRQWLERDRNHPSIVMWSADNEATSQCWESISRAEELVKINQFMKEIDPTRPIDNEGDYTLRFDHRVDMVNLHYPESGWIRAWQMKYKKPLILGEIMSLSCYHEFFSFKKLDALAPALKQQAHWYREEIKNYQNLDISGICPFSLEWNGFCGDDPAVSIGPWGKRGVKWRNPLWVDVPWPALSGPDAKVEKILTGYLHGYINWFDPAYPIFTPTCVYEAIKETFRPMPKLTYQLSPQVIIKVTKDEQPVSRAYVFLSPEENQATNPVGVMADKEGKAWFRLPEEGKYKVSCPGYEQMLIIKVDDRKISSNPGYDIPEVELKIEQKRSND